MADAEWSDAEDGGIAEDASDELGVTDGGAADEDAGDGPSGSDGETLGDTGGSLVDAMPFEDAPACGPPKAGTNLVLNPDFESASADKSWSAPQSGTMAFSSDHAHCGSRCGVLKDRTTYYNCPGGDAPAPEGSY